MKVCAGSDYIPVSRMVSGTGKSDFEKNGYLLVRNLIPRRVVRSGLKDITYFLAKELDHSGSQLKPGKKLMDCQQWIQNSAVFQVLENKKLFELAESILGWPVTTMRFKWLRAVGKGENTGLHNDAYYLGHISPKMLTIWIALMDIPTGMGGLIVCSGSHRADVWDQIQAEYKKKEKGNGTTSGWITNKPSVISRILRKRKRELKSNERIEWATTDFKIGDVVVLDMKTMHMTGTNTTNELRISCDTRWLALPFV